MDNRVIPDKLEPPLIHFMLAAKIQVMCRKSSHLKIRNDKERISSVLQRARDAMKEGELPIYLADKLLTVATTSEVADQWLLVHAEMKALQQIDEIGFSHQERRRLTIYCNLEPCMMCLGAAMSLFVGKLVYSMSANSDGMVRLV